MSKTELNKQWIYKLFLELITQQETKDSKFAVRFGEEKRKVEFELGQKLDLNLSEVHLIACIGDHGPINVTTISEKTDLTKGSVTRITQKLLASDLIKKQQLHDNKKEVYFRLTAKGQKLYKIHDREHRAIEQRFMHLLDKYTPEQLTFARELLQDLLEWDY